MSSKRKRLLAAALLAASVMAAGESALTDSNTLPATTAGYGSTEVTGATVYSIAFTPNAPGTQITDTAIQFTGNYSTGYTIKAGFGSDALTACSVTAYDGVHTAVACTGYAQPTASALLYRVLVTNG